MATGMEIEPLDIQEPPELPGDLEIPEETPEPAEAAAPPPEEEDPEVTDMLRDMGLDPDKKGRVSKRVKQLLGRAKAAEEKALESDSWKQEALRLATLKEAKAPVFSQDTSTLPELPPDIPPEPKFDDFDDTVEYYKAVAKREAVIAVRKEQASAQQEALQKSTQDWVKAGKELYPDFDEVATKEPQFGGPVITPNMAQAMMANPSGQEIAYYLGKNPQESMQIANLHPVAQAIEIRKLAVKVKAKPPKTTTEAPAPTKPVTGGRENVSTSNLEERIAKGTISYKEYEAYMNKREQGG